MGSSVGRQASVLSVCVACSWKQDSIMLAVLPLVDCYADYCAVEGAIFVAKSTMQIVGCQHQIRLWDPASTDHATAQHDRTYSWSADLDMHYSTP